MAKTLSEDDIREIFANNDSGDSDLESNDDYSDCEPILERQNDSDNESETEDNGNANVYDDVLGLPAAATTGPDETNSGSGDHFVDPVQDANPLPDRVIARGRPRVRVRGGGARVRGRARVRGGRIARPANVAAHVDDDGGDCWSDVSQHSLDWLPPYQCPFPGKPKINTQGYKPVDFFRETFPDRVIETLVVETNRYYRQFAARPENIGSPGLNDWYDVTAGEMNAFLSILILMGLTDTGFYRVHWSTDPLLHKPGFRDIMSRNRFERIMRFFHCVNNDNQIPRGQPGYDRGFKVRSQINSLVEAWNDAFHMEKQMSVDECMVKFKGRCTMIQYMKSKPIKWGLKGWVLAGAKTNYVHQWRLYVGKEDNVRTENLGYQVVNDISSDMVPGQELYCDSLFTSVKLFQELQSKNIGACGTTQSNRKGNPKDLRPFNKKTPKRRLEELSPLFRYHDGSYLMAVGWFDKRPVCLLSTVDNDNIMTKRIRARGQGQDGHREIQKPVAVDRYNSYMGGVDGSDQQNSYFIISHRSVKWWKKVFFHLLITAVSNAYVIYKTSVAAADRLDNRSFRLKVAHGLLVGYQRRRVEPRRMSATVDSPRRLDGLAHFMEKTPDKQRPDCTVCTIRDNNKYVHRKQTQRRCKTCVPNIPLCDIPCFEIYHSKVDYKGYWKDNFMQK